MRGFPLRKFLQGFILLFLFMGCAKKDIPLPDHPGGQLYSGIARKAIRCVKCHGTRGEGKFSAPALVVSGKTMPSEKFTVTVLKGRGRMPRFEDLLTKEEIAQIIDWLENVSPL